jgi:hypothetical protein
MFAQGAAPEMRFGCSGISRVAGLAGLLLAVTLALGANWSASAQEAKPTTGVVDSPLFFAVLSRERWSGTRRN